MQRSAIAYSICRHLSENGYQWPRSWDDLKPSFDAEIGNESPWDYETLKSTVLSVLTLMAQISSLPVAILDMMTSTRFNSKTNSWIPTNT